MKSPNCLVCIPHFASNRFAISSSLNSSAVKGLGNKNVISTQVSEFIDLGGETPTWLLLGS